MTGGPGFPSLFLSPFFLIESELWGEPLLPWPSPDHKNLTVFFAPPRSGSSIKLSLLWVTLASFQVDLPGSMFLMLCMRFLQWFCCSQATLGYKSLCHAAKAPLSWLTYFSLGLLPSPGGGGGGCPLVSMCRTPLWGPGKSAIKHLSSCLPSPQLERRLEVSRESSAPKIPSTWTFNLCTRSFLCVCVCARSVESYKNTELLEQNGRIFFLSFFFLCLLPCIICSP